MHRPKGRQRHAVVGVAVVGNAVNGNAGNGNVVSDNAVNGSAVSGTLEARIPVGIETRISAQGYKPEAEIASAASAVVLSWML